MILTDTNYRETFLFLKDGILMTLQITLMAFPVATLIGLFTGLGRLSKNTFVYTVATLYVELIRGVPLVVLILMIAFGIIPVFVDLVNLIGNWGINLVSSGILGDMFTWMQEFSIRAIPMELRAVIALSLAYGAFEAEVFRAGIQSISHGQMEAARSLGMSYIQSMRFVVLPQAIRPCPAALRQRFYRHAEGLFPGDSPGGQRADPTHPPAPLEHLPRHGSLQCGDFFYLSLTLLLSGLVRLLERKMRIEE